jgi:hypothetical protein
MEHSLSPARQRVVRSLIMQRQEAMNVLRECDEGIGELLNSYSDGLDGKYTFFLSGDGTITLRQREPENDDAKTAERVAGGEDSSAL